MQKKLICPECGNSGTTRLYQIEPFTWGCGVCKTRFMDDGSIVSS